MFAIIPDGILGTVICLAAERSGIAFGLGATESKQDSQSLHYAFQSIMQTRQDFSWICVIPLVRFVKSPLGVSAVVYLAFLPGTQASPGYQGHHGSQSVVTT